MNDVFFVLSKITWGFLSPINVIIWLMILATFFLIMGYKRIALTLLVPTSIISFLILAYPVGDIAMYPLESRFHKPMSMPEQVDGIIVLGGGEELRPSISWNISELGKGGDRYLGARVLAELYPVVPVIFTGGSNLITLQDSQREGDIARQLLSEMGIEESRLIIESNSRNTYENFLFVKPRLPNRNGHYLLVTSAYHMPRAVGVARKMNVNVIPYPVDYRSNRDDLRRWDFNLFEHLEVLEPAWREWIGLTVYFITGKTSSWFSE